MSGVSTFTTARKLVIAKATIPAAASAVTVASLIASALAAQGESDNNIIAWALGGLVASGATRGQIALGHAAGAVYAVYDSGEDVLPVTSDTSVFIGGVAGAIVDCVFEVYLK